MKNVLFILVSLFLTCSSGTTNSDTYGQIVNVEYINASMVDTPILYCIDINHENGQICKYSISSLANDSYYRGLCLLKKNEDFNCESIQNLNFDIITRIGLDSVVEGFKFISPKPSGYKPYESESEYQISEDVKFKRKIVHIYNGYSSINCFNKQYSFDSIFIDRDSILISGLKNGDEELADLKVAKWNCEIEENTFNELSILKVNRLLEDIAGISKYFKIDSVYVRCLETLRLVPSPSSRTIIDSSFRNTVFSLR